MASLFNAISEAASSAADTVSNTVTSGIDGAVIKVAEEKVKEHTGTEVEIVFEDVPDNRKSWMRGTGLNCLCTEDSWAFLEGSYNERKRELWKERNINKIILTVDENPDEEDRWIAVYPEWETGSRTLKLWFHPRAFQWGDDTTWMSPSYKRWWNVADEIVFGLQLYQLAGKCFYKSDWFDDFEDVDENSCIPNGTHKVSRWFQFRHWIIYWYREAQWGYNWAYTPKPPKLPDGSLFSLDSVLSCPSLPDFKMPNIKLPSLPDVELPSLPSVDLPSIEAPSISAPSLSAPSLSLSGPPSMPDRLKRPSSKWAAHGYIELTDLKVKADGSSVILSNAKLTNFWDKNGHIDTEEKERARLVLKTTNSEQADSWKQSLMASGVEEGDAGGCCTVA